MWSIFAMFFPLPDEVTTMRYQLFVLYLVRALRSFMIVMPVIGIYFLEHGLSVKDIFVLQVIFSIAVILFEVPSGYLADVFGRKVSLVLGAMLGAIGFLLYYLAPSYVGFVFAEIILALSVGFFSGAQSAFLYDMLLQYGRETEYKKFAGRFMSVGTLSEAIGALSATLALILLEIHTLFLIDAGLIAIAFLFALSLREPRRHEEQKHVSMLEAVHFATRENKKLKVLNVFSGFLSASTLTMVWFTQPYWQALDVEVTYFGVMWAALMLASSVGSFYAHHVSGNVRFKTLFGVFGISVFVLYGALGLGAGHMATLLVLPFFWLLRGVSAPLINDYVNRETASAMRATVLSINQLYARIIFSLLSPFLGWVSDTWSFETAFFASALTLGVATFVTAIFFVGVHTRREKVGAY